MLPSAPLRHFLGLAALVVVVCSGCPEGPGDEGGGSSSGGGGGSSSSGRAGSSGAVSSSGGSPSSGASSSLGSPSSGATSGSPDGGVGPDGGSCDLGTPGAPDRERVVMLSHTFTDVPATPGTWVRTLGWKVGQLPEDTGVRVDVGARIMRLAFVPSGTYALALGDDGDLVSLRVDGVANVVEVDRVTLPSAGFEDLVVAADGRRVWAVGSNVAETAGLSTVDLGCDGALTVLEGAFFNIRLAESLVLLPGGTQAILLGGQAAFDPVDNDDTRLLALVPGGGFTSVAAFDLWSDFLDVGRIGLSPAGDLLVVPNSSPFSSEGGQVRIFTVTGDSIASAQVPQDVPSAREVLFSPDGLTVLISRDENNRVAVFRRDGNQLTPTTEVTGIGLASQMAMVTRGLDSGRVVVPSVDPSGGPNLAVFRVTGPGAALYEGQLELGSGSDQIPEAVAVQP
ncbi:MAG: hypothetical protein HY904_00525 [Deltaproteobacteria bacterium]|nr:hypothetical protein [Deltaproteobacteria bacterium]